MIQILDRKIIRCEIDGRPHGLSITPSDDLLATVQRGGMFNLNIYKLPEVECLKTIHLPTEILFACPAVQTTYGDFIIASVNTNFFNMDGMYVINELSMDGKQINRTFDPQTTNSIPLKTPVHLAMDEDGNIFVADSSDDRHRVFKLNSRLNRIEMELNHDRHQITRPWRLCYVQEKHMLIVGQESLSTVDGSFCVFKCC